MVLIYLVSYIYNQLINLKIVVQSALYVMDTIYICTTRRHNVFQCSITLYLFMHLYLFIHVFIYFM